MSHLPATSNKQTHTRIQTPKFNFDSNVYKYTSHTHILCLLCRKLEILSSLHFTPDCEYDTVLALFFFGKIVNSCVCSNSHHSRISFFFYYARGGKCTMYIYLCTHVNYVRTRTNSQVIFNVQKKKNRKESLLEFFVAEHLNTTSLYIQNHFASIKNN